MDAVIDNDGLNYIIWAKRHKIKGSDIKDFLSEQGMTVTEARISQLWGKNKRNNSLGKNNPYDADQLTGQSTTEEMAGNPMITNVDAGNSDVKETIDKNYDSTQFITPNNLSPVLNIAGVPKKKAVQIVETFNMTDGTWESLARVLNLTGINWHVQKQIIAQTFGIAVLDKMEGRATEKKADTGKSPGTNNNINMAQALIQQKIAAKQNSLALAQVEDTLSRLDDKPKKDGNFGDIKDLIALDVYANRNTKDKDSLLEKVLVQKMVKEDTGVNSLVGKLIDNQKNNGDKKMVDILQNQITKLSDELRKQQSGSESVLEKILIQKMLKEDTNNNSLITRLLDNQKNNGDDKSGKIVDVLQNQVLSLSDELRKQQAESSNNFVKMTVEQLKGNKEREEQNMEKLRELEQEKIAMQQAFLRDKVENSVRSESDFMAGLQDKLVFAEKMGLTKNNDNSNQSLARLQTVEKIVNNIPGQIEQGMGSVLDKVEGGLIRYLEYQEKKDQRWQQMQVSQMNQPRFNPREARTPEERGRALVSIENSIDNIERARRNHEKMSKLL